jgi:hypothetical protein
MVTYQRFLSILPNFSGKRVKRKRLYTCLPRIIQKME